MTVPCGFVHGLPIGVSFFSRAYAEGALLTVAYAQATHHRARPRFVASLDDG